MGALLLIASGVMIVKQIDAIRSVREITVPLVAHLPEMERRANVLKEQIELTELQSALRVGSQEERMKVFVLPERADRERIVALFDVFHSLLKQSGRMAEASQVSFGDPFARDGLTAVPLSIRYSIDDRGMRELLKMVRLSGLLTIADTLTYEEREWLFDTIEKQNPAGIAVLEQYLSVDLMDYVVEPRPHDEQLKRAFPDEAFRTQLDDLFAKSFRRDAVELFGGKLGAVLRDRNLWPMPLMTVSAARTEPSTVDGWFDVSLDLLLYQRSPE